MRTQLRAAANNVKQKLQFYLLLDFAARIPVNQGDLALAATLPLSAVVRRANGLPLAAGRYLKRRVHTALKIPDTNKTWQSHQQRLFCLSVSGAATVIVYDKNRFCKISPWITQ